MNTVADFCELLALVPVAAVVAVNDQPRRRRQPATAAAQSKVVALGVTRATMSFAEAASRKKETPVDRVPPPCLRPIDEDEDDSDNSRSSWSDEAESLLASDSGASRSALPLVFDCAEPSRQRQRQRVTFAEQVHVREYAVIVGDVTMNGSADAGASAAESILPLQLDWCWYECQRHVATSRNRDSSYQLPLQLTLAQRRDRLQRVSGYDNEHLDAIVDYQVQCRFQSSTLRDWKSWW